MKKGLLQIQFEQLFEHNFKKIYSHALSYVKDEEASKDIAHEVFISVWNNRNSIDFSRPIYGYLQSLTRNRCLNYLKHQKVQIRHEHHLSVFAEFYETMDTDEDAELVEKIIARMEQLPDKCSVVMRLCFLECKKYKEIADELGISVNTVKAHIVSGLNILRKDFPDTLLLALFFRVQKKMIIV